MLSNRSKLRDIPAEVLRHGHHLVHDRFHFMSVQDAVTIAVVESEHKLQFVFRATAFQQRKIAYDVLERNLKKSLRLHIIN